MKKTYEAMVLLDNREVRKGWDALKSEVAGMFTKHEAEVVSARRWDERRLAFPIKGQQRGTYLLMYFSAPPANIGAINRDLMYADSVLRHLTLICDEVPAEAHEPEAEFDESSVPTDDVAPAADAEGSDDKDAAPAADDSAAADSEVVQDADDSADKVGGER